MPYDRPTLTELLLQAQTDISSSPIGADGFLKEAVLPTLGGVQAGFAYEHYGYIDEISLQAVPWTATGEFLAGWGALKGLPREDATFAAGGGVQFQGTTGTPMPAGTAIVRSDGFPFVTTTDAVWTGNTATVSVQASTAGAAGNLAAGTAMTLAAPISNVQSRGVATLLITGGNDQETPDAYKTRVLAQYANQPQGGDLEDYVLWAMQVPGVTRAWSAAGLGGAGTVTLFFMMDNTEAAFGGFPQGTNGVAAADAARGQVATGDQLAVATYVYPLHPATALVYFNAPPQLPIPFTIASLGAGNTATNQALIAAALADLFVRRSYVGGTTAPNGAPFTPMSASDWYAAISSVPGLGAFTVTAPAGLILPGAGQLPVVGAIQFVS